LVPFSEAAGRRQAAVDREAGSVVHEDMPLVVQLGFMGVALAEQPSLRIGGRGMRGVAAALAMEIDRGVAGVIRGTAGGVRPLEALETGPGLDQRAVDGEVLIGEDAPAAGFRHHALEEGPGDVALQQPLAILREDGGIPDRVVRLQAPNQRKSRL